MGVTTRSVAAALTCIVCAASTAVHAASVEIERNREEIRAHRQEIVAAAMELTDDEALAFWPAYRNYRADMARVEDRLVELLTGLVEAGDALTDAEALRLIDEYLDIEASAVGVRKRHAGRLRVLLPPPKVARFLQLENKLDAVIRLELAETIPLVR